MSLWTRTEKETGKPTVEASELAVWSQIIRDALVAIGVLGGALWALYIFVLGRTTTANVQIDYSLKKVINLADSKKAAVVSVKLTNTGRTQVLKKENRSYEEEPGCMATVTPIIAFPPEGLEPYLISLSSIDQQNSTYLRPWRIFERLDALQPGEEAVEDFLFGWSNSLRFASSIPTFKIDVQFLGKEAFTLGKWRFYIGQEKTWASGGILYARDSPEQGEAQREKP